GGREGEFLVLHPGSSVSRLSRNLLGFWGRSDWLAAPVRPTWPLNGRPLPRAEDVLVNALDEEGWLLVVRGLGAARYRTRPAAAGGGRGGLGWRGGGERGWAGPFFGSLQAARPALAALADVRLARLHGEVAYLATSRGLFGRDPQGRRTVCAIPNGDVHELLP